MIVVYFSLELTLRFRENKRVDVGGVLLLLVSSVGEIILCENDRKSRVETTVKVALLNRRTEEMKSLLLLLT